MESNGRERSFGSLMLACFALSILFLTFTTLSGEPSVYEIMKQQSLLYRPLDIEKMPGGDVRDLRDLRDASSVLSNKLQRKAMALIESDDFNNDTIRQELWDWYRGEAERLRKGLYSDVPRAHFKTWTIEHFKHFARSDLQEIHRLYLILKERQGAFGNTTFYRDASFDNLDREIQSIRDLIAEQGRVNGSVELAILHEQDNAEILIHNKNLEASVNTSPQAGLNYLNWPRVREILSPHDRRRHFDALNGKLNAIAEQKTRDYAYSSGGDIASEQLIHDIQTLRSEIESLRAEVNRLKDQLGDPPRAYNHYSTLDQSAEARLSRQSKRLDSLIQQLNTERLFSQ